MTTAHLQMLHQKFVLKFRKSEILWPCFNLSEFMPHRSRILSQDQIRLTSSI